MAWCSLGFLDLEGAWGAGEEEPTVSQNYMLYSLLQSAFGEDALLPPHSPSVIQRPPSLLQLLPLPTLEKCTPPSRSPYTGAEWEGGSLWPHFLLFGQAVLEMRNPLCPFLPSGEHPSPPLHLPQKFSH